MRSFLEDINNILNTGEAGWTRKVLIQCQWIIPLYLFVSFVGSKLQEQWYKRSDLVTHCIKSLLNYKPDKCFVPSISLFLMFATVTYADSFLQVPNLFAADELDASVSPGALRRIATDRIRRIGRIGRMSLSLVRLEGVMGLMWLGPKVIEFLLYSLPRHVFLTIWQVTWHGL